MRAKSLFSPLFWTLLVMLSPLLSACTTGAAGPVAGQETTISVSGAFALYPMMITWAEEYQKLHPEVRIDVSAGGAGKGMSDVLGGAVDIGMISREVTPEETSKGAYALPVVKDAVFATVSSQNPALPALLEKGINAEILKGIYITGEITTWDQVTGSSGKGVELHIYTRSDSSGAAEIWAKFLGKRQEDLLGIGVFGDPGILDAVIKDPQGLAYNNLNYAYDIDSGLPVTGAAVVPIDVNGNGLIDLDEELDTKQRAINAVASGRYPSPPARDLNLVTKGKPSGAIGEFLTWVLEDGQSFVEQAGYIPLIPEQISEGLSKLR